MSKQMVLNCFVHAQDSWARAGEFEFGISTIDMSACAAGFFAVCQQRITIEIPADWNPVAAQVAAIKEEAAAFESNVAAKRKELAERLAKLECLEYTA